jgi:hypothetical protein
MGIEHEQDPDEYEEEPDGHDGGPDVQVDGRLGQIAELRVEAVTALAAGDFPAAIELTGTALDQADRLLRDLAGRPEMRDSLAAPVVMTTAALHADMSVALLAVGDIERAGQHRDRAADLAGLGEPAIVRFTAVSVCRHGQPSFTGRCYRRPPCPQ